MLAQPPPSAVYSYSWVKFSSLPPNLTASPSTIFNISGGSPCCVPFSNATSQEIAADNPGNVYASNPRGSIMGRCDLASRNASFGWYSHQYNLTTLTGSGDSLILVINNSSSSASSPSPDVAASAMPGKLSADPWQMVMWPSFISGHVYPPLHHSP